ncbi:MAG: hypothetical protein IJH39_01105 [Clostridia bacterium]|nr:hypothetical protein [Clostridia bacterium]
MDEEQKQKLYAWLDKIKETDENRELIETTRQNIADDDMISMYENLQKLESMNLEVKEETFEEKAQRDAENNYENEDDSEENIDIYPDKLARDDLEKLFIGLLLNEPKSIAVYYFTYEECYFANEKLLNIYKMILFTDAEKYAPEVAKRNFNFARVTEEANRYKDILTENYANSEANMEEVYTKLKKIFVLRKNYLAIPVKNIQKDIVEILDYELYNQMSVEEVQSAVDQVTATEKFKRAILNQGITEFLLNGDNTLTNGLKLPFKILSSVFKGIRQGETMAFAMPSNAGKSRFTMNLAAYVALMHKKKVLVISNEMSEEKMKLCLITTILNNPEIQKLHGQKLHISEGELLEFKFRPDDAKNVKVDEEGYVVREKKETQAQLAKRLDEISTEFKMTKAVTDWFNKQVKNYIYFINITDHTNDELKKVIMNYYYKEKVEYVFYDTLKTDIDNIGNGEEIKRTATILANLAQNFKMYIGSTIQLSETKTDPINLDINDLAVSRTVKEVLDTLCLFKQIHNEDLDKYEYSLNEVDTKFFDLERSKNPDVRYYACVVDKNRAGSKPKVVFRLNLAYNEWNELGYLRLKSK